MFRHFADRDLEQVLELCADEGWSSYVEDDVAQKVFTEPGVVSVVADDAGEVVAFAYLQSDGSIQAHLSLLVVAPDRRREGLARSLLELAIPLSGARWVDLITDAAGDFYRSLAHEEKSGFRIYPS